MAYELEVPVRHRTFWLAFTDPERLARAVPGLTVDAVQPVPPAEGSDGIPGDVVAGRLKLRVGAATITYRGTATIATAEAEAGTLDVAVDVAQARGNGALAGYLRIALRPVGESGERTSVSVVPELEVSGRALDLKNSELHEAALALAGEWISALAAEYQADASLNGVVEAVVEPVVETELVGETEAETAVEAEAIEIEATVEAEAEVAPEPSSSESSESSDAAESEPVSPALPSTAVSKAENTLPAERLESEPLFDDSLSADPLEPVWRGEFERNPWIPVIAALTFLALVRRRRRRRRRAG